MVDFFAYIITVFFAVTYGQALKTSTFASPAFDLTQGQVNNKVYYGVDFPAGHIAVKSFDAELVYDNGSSVPLHEAYLHHWVVYKYFQRKGLDITANNYFSSIDNGGVIQGKLSGLCQGAVLQQYWGLGSETRRTASFIPDPYGVETGDFTTIPYGYEEKWFLNVHAIDTRGVSDKRGCLECRCDLYNATASSDGQALPRGYAGGLQCCRDGYQCKLGQPGEISARRLRLKYTVKWAEWDSSILPVRIFILDVTDNGARNSTNSAIGCQVEYQVPPCGHHKCEYKSRTSLTITKGGYLIYGVSHIHLGGKHLNLYKQNGRKMCESKAIYGTGKEAGNEEGYVVGMTTCYPKPGTIKIEDNEVVVLESNYDNKVSHSGVMGLFYMLVADELPKSLP